MSAYTTKPIEKYLEAIPAGNILYVTVYLRPEIYVDSEIVVGSAYYNLATNSPTTDVNPSRRINGPLSDYGEELEPPIKAEYDEFTNDCAWLVDNSGFKILKRFRSEDSKKSEYIVVFGMKDEPCGAIVFDLRISDHPLDATFPEELKGEVLELLKMEKVLDESATKAGINFRVEQVVVGSVKDDTWARAFDRLGNLLDRMRVRVRKQINREKREGKR